MRYVHYNPNPDGRTVDDCTIRAISRVFDLHWQTAFWELAHKAFDMSDIQISNAVFLAYLKERGFKPRTLPDRCPECYTVDQFAYDHPYGTYIVATGTHVVAVVDGQYYDSWDSGREIPTYYFEREDER